VTFKPHVQQTVGDVDYCAPESVRACAGDAKIRYTSTFARRVAPMTRIGEKFHRPNLGARWTGSVPNHLARIEAGAPTGLVGSSRNDQNVEQTPTSHRHHSDHEFKF